jgi:hypothetical protein
MRKLAVAWSNVLTPFFCKPDGAIARLCWREYVLEIDQSCGVRIVYMDEKGFHDGPTTMRNTCGDQTWHNSFTEEC